jgi:prepilin-type N-terminal cleavage/methylation domain-containing protein
MQRHSRTTRRGPAFTLIEMLVVIAILMILMAVVVPMAGDAMEKGKRPNCIANLKQIGLAFQGYAQDNKGRYPRPMDPSKLPFGDMAPMGNLGFPCPIVLWENSYLPDPRLLYCPSARFITFQTSWDSNAWSKTYSSYSFYAGYTNPAIGTANCQLWFAMTIDWNPETLLAMDNCCFWQPERSWNRSSHQRGNLKGGHILGNDIHVEWRPSEVMSNRFSQGGGDFYF